MSSRSKLEALPDIDLSEKDVYETPDELVKPTGPLKSSQTEQPSTESPDILVEEISVTKSGQLFQYASLDASNADFSDVLATRKQKLYRARIENPVTELESFARKPIELVETPKQKLQRLLYEVNELEQELLEKSDSHAEETKEELGGLLDQLKSVEALGERMGMFKLSEADTIESNKRLFESLVNQVQGNGVSTSMSKDVEQEVDKTRAIYELYQSPLTIKSQFKSAISSLDSRLAQLETVLGIDAINNVQNINVPSNLISSLQELKTQMLILNGQNSEEIVKRCSLMIAELDELISKRNEAFIENEASNFDPDSSEKVKQIYSLWEGLEKFHGLLPNILERLVALKEVHAEAANFDQSLKTLSDQMHQMKEALKNAEDICKKLEVSMPKNQDIILKNLQLLKN